MGKISKAFDKATQEEIVSDGSRQTASMAEEEAPAMWTAMLEWFERRLGGTPAR